MKQFLRLLVLAVLSFLCSTFTYATENPPDDILLVLEKAAEEQKAIRQQYEIALSMESQKLLLLQQQMLTSGLSTEQKLDLLLQKMEIKETLEVLEETYNIELGRVRYEKGIELIKMMYEKTLGLDHHFTSLQTYQSINQMSNPTSYPEFQKVQEEMQKRLKKDNAIRLPSLLTTNPFLSAAFSLTATLLGDGDARKKEDDLTEVSCILDFTVRMNADLSLIYYETEFLKESNRSLKEDGQLLFDKYSQVVGYNVPLDKCRKTDDWETLNDKQDVFFNDLEETSKLNDPTQTQKIHKGIVNVEFAVDQLLDFLGKYSMFINQGEKYYQKFNVIVSNYENEVHCAGKLPHQFTTLKKDIQLSIDRFNEAYNIAELKGTRLKDLLYGMEK